MPSLPAERFPDPACDELAELLLSWARRPDATTKSGLAHVRAERRPPATSELVFDVEDLGEQLERELPAPRPGSFDVDEAA